MKTRFPHLVSTVLLLAANPLSARPVGLLRHEMASLDSFIAISGNPPALIATDPQASHAPYLSLNNGLVRIDLPFPMRQDFTLRAKILHTSYERIAWIGLFNEEGTQGYGVSWDSSTPAIWGGAGFVGLRKFSLTAELSDWIVNGTPVGSVQPSGHPATQKPFAELVLSWRKDTGQLTASLDGVILLQEEALEFSSFARLYFKANGTVFLDDVQVESGCDPESAIRLADTFNERPGSLEPRWMRVSGTAVLENDGNECVVSAAAHGTRYETALDDLGPAASHPLINIGYCARRSVPQGNSGGLFLVAADGTGVGFLTELADDAFQRTTLQVATTTNAGQNWSVIAYKEFPGISGQQFHRIGFTWDRVAGTVRGTIDDASPQQIAGSGVTMSGLAQKCVLFSQFAPTLKLDNLLVTRVPAAAALATNHGVTGNGTTDDQSALQTLFTAAKASGVPVFLPLGVYRHSGTLAADGIDIIGAGPACTLIATAAPNGHIKHDALVLSGSGGSVAGCRFVSENRTVRCTNPDSSGILADVTSDFSIAGNWVEDCAGAGIFLHGASTRGRVFGNVVLRSSADGIHVNDGSNDIAVFGNTVLETGDDYISVVSYHPKLCARVDVFGNRAKAQTFGRGLTVVGGQSALIAGNDIDGSFGAGLYVASEDSYGTTATSDVLLKDNTLTNVTTGTLGHAAIHVSGRTGYQVGNIRIESNRVSQSPAKGVALLTEVENVLVRSNNFQNMGGIGAFVSGAKNATLTGNTFERIGKYGVYVDHPATDGSLTLSGNTFVDIHAEGSETYIDVINIGAGTSLDSITLQNNAFENRAGYPIERFIENFAGGISSASGNLSTPPTPSYP